MPDIAQQIAIDKAALDRNLQFLTELEKARSRYIIESYFPDSGKYRRELYPKHIRFFAAGGRHDPMPECPNGCDGSPHRERCLMAGNRIGKTKAAAFEVVCHATGKYPPWWTGLRYDHAPLIWVANDTSYNTRDVNQLELLGSFDRVGTGMLPSRYIIGEPVRRSGIQRAFESVDVEHVSGGTSTLYFKAYEQGWEAFTGRAIDLIWCDEEPPQDVYAECCVRTMTTQGHILLTFTPLEGVTEVVKSFIDSYNTDEAKV
jgi:phage terminase large subunit-like protein